MRQISGGTFVMGSNDFYPEEAPARAVAVEDFWIDERPVTASEFRRFVRETGYVTVAERPLDPADYPGAHPDVLVPGSLVFRKTAGPVDVRDYRKRFVQGQGNLTVLRWEDGDGPEDAKLIVGNDLGHLRGPDALPWE